MSIPGGYPYWLISLLILNIIDKYRMGGQKRKREEIRASPTTSSITCSINLSDILKINEDGSAVITMPKAPDGYYFDQREILEQLSKAGILKGNETYKF